MIISKNNQPVPASVALFLCSLLLAWLSGCSGEDDSVQKRPVQQHRVAVVTADVREVKHQQTISGTIEATTSVRLYNEESARIANLPYFEGDTVSKGTVVITLIDDLIRAELDKARAQHAQAEIDLRRLKKLLPKNLTSEEEVARAETALNIAKAEENLQQTRLDRTKIRAPFDGVISQRNNEPGDAVSSHTHILSMIDPNTLRVTVQISERWIPLINEGDKVQVIIDALGDKKHSGHVSRIHPTIDENTRKGTLEIMLQPVPDGARAGQLARVQITTQSAERLVVPTQAVQHDMNGAFVYKVVSDDQGNSVTQRAAIVKGAQFGDWIELLSGAQAGDKIIVKGFLGLRNNKKVSIVNNETTL